MVNARGRNKIEREEEELVDDPNTSQYVKVKSKRKAARGKNKKRDELSTSKHVRWKKTKMGRKDSQEKKYKCDNPNCKYSTNRKRHMESHAVVHSDQRPYKCGKCDRAFKLPVQLKSHLNCIHSSKKPFLCDECGRSYKLKSVLKRHALTHSKERPLKCGQCEFSTAYGSNLQNHLLSKHPATSKLYECDHPNCRYSTHVPSYFKIHKNTHIVVKSFKCDQCDYATCYNIHLKNHRLSKHPTTSQLYKCDRPKCQYSTRVLVYLKQHKMKTHMFGKIYECDKCNHSTANRSDLENHRLSKHSKTSKILKCDHPNCHYSTPVPTYFNHHKKAHLVEKRVKCDKCDRVFKNKYLLQSHSVLHAKEKRLKCEKCLYSSNYESSLRAHKVKHVNEKKHKCKECGDSYSFLKQLKKHQLKHDDKIKKFKCDRCPFRTFKKRYLYHHSRTHSKTHELNAKLVKSEYLMVNPYYLENDTEEPKSVERCRRCGLALRDQSESRVHADAHKPCSVTLRRSLDSRKVIPKVEIPFLLPVKVELDEVLKREIILSF